MAGVGFEHLTQYPTELTNRWWQKQKGTLGKLAKTGLGDALDAAEALFRKIDLSILDPSSSPSRTIAELDAKVTDAKAHYAKTVAPLMKELGDVRTAAKAAADKLKKLPGAGGAAKAALEIEKVAATFAVTCKSLDLEASIARVRADIAKKDGVAKKLLGDSLKRFVAGAKAFMADPTYESWGDNIKQQGRSVSNSVAQISELRDRFWTDFEKFKGFDEGTLKLSRDDPGVEDRMKKIVALALGEVKKIAAARV
jgi:hypothetical protein